jgi:hypothetical protein
MVNNIPLNADHFMVTLLDQQGLCCRGIAGRLRAMGDNHKRCCGLTHINR